MTKKLPPEKKKKRGRPSLYNPEIHPKIAGDLALMGKTQPEIAKAIGVDEDTVIRWRKEFPEFAGAIKENKDQADSVVVASLYQRACGYEYTEKSEKVDPEKGTIVTTTIKHVAPDTTAQIFWLKNRQPQDWRDKQQVEHSGTVVMHFDKEDAGL
jgi:transposase-like protein